MFKYFLKEFNPIIQDIAFKLSFLSVNCIKWSCIFSGFGIIHPFTEKDIKILDALTPDKNDLKQIVKDSVPLDCIYKKGKPVFSLPIDTISDPGKYMWNYSTFDKRIDISTQAFAILSLITASKLLYRYDINTSLVMLKEVENLICFSSAYLKHDDGMYISAENKEKEINNTINLKYTKSEPKLIDQVFMYEAYLCYSSIISDNIYPDCILSSVKKHADEGKYIFEYISSNISLLLKMSTRDISMCISSMARCCSIDHNIKNIECYKEIVTILCAELESRTKVTGEIDRSSSDLTPASHMTHFRAASALIEGSLLTGINKFMEASETVYCYLSNSYDTNLGIYLKELGKTISITIRDICEMIKFQLLRYSVYETHEALYIANRLYNEWIEASGIVQCVPNYKDTFLGSDTDKFDNLKKAENISIAPVFLKSVEFNIKKSSQCIPSGSFNSYYSLYSSYTFLYYLSSLIPEPTCLRSTDNDSSKESFAEIKDETIQEMDTKPNSTEAANTPEEILESVEDNNVKCVN